MTDVGDVISKRATKLLVLRLLAPIAAPVAAGAVMGTLWAVLAGPGENAFPVAAMINWVALTIVVALVATFVVGLPWHAFAYSRGWRRSWAYWPAGIVLGVALLSIITMPFGIADEMAEFIVYSGMVGGLTALFAWLIRRPDRDPPNPPTPAP
jgi:hypothetical protein